MVGGGVGAFGLLKKQLTTVTFNCKERDFKIIDKNNLDVTAVRQN